MWSFFEWNSTGSVIGGIKSTQEVVDFCAEKGILPDVEVCPVSKLGEIYDILDRKNDAIKRYVLDIAGTMEAAHSA